MGWKKRLIAVLVLLAVLVAGGAFFYVTHQRKTPEYAMSEITQAL